MTRPMAARVRAIAALHALDRTPSGHGHGPNRQDQAMAKLGDALNALYGPLPAIRVRGWDDDEELHDRDDAIGDELADREGL